MPAFDTTSLSSRGQVVIPQKLRKKMGITTGVKLAILTDGSNLPLKPILPPGVEDFKKLIKESRELVVKEKIRPPDLKRIIKEVRNGSYN